MKKTYIRLLGLLLVIVMLLTGCNDGGVSSDTETSEKENTETEQTTENTEPEPDEAREFIELPNTINLLTAISDTDVMDSIVEFKTELENKTGVTLRKVNSSIKPTSMEILIGNISSRQQSVDFYEEISYADCTVKYSDGKLMVASYSESTIEAALDAIIERLAKNDNGKWGIWSDISYVRSVVKISDSVPKFSTSKGKLIEGVKSNDGFLVGYTGATSAEFDAYCKELSDAGFTQHYANGVKQNKFATYVTDETMVHISWQGAISTFRLVVSPKTYVPATEAPAYEKLAEPSVAQLEGTGCAMGFVMQLEDGSFIVVDGGLNYSSDKMTLLNYLRRNKPDSHDKPHVTWIFTHPHSDHVGLALSFLETYSNDIYLDLLSYNFPDMDSLTMSEYGQGSDEYVRSAYSKLDNIMAKYYRETDIFIHHTGQKLSLAGCTIEFLYTQEDWWPNKCQTYNDTCSTFKVTFASGYDFLIMGDLDEGGCNQMAAVWGDYLQSDIFQPTHHGQKGGTEALYKLIKPTYVFWANTEENCTKTTGDVYSAPVHCTERASFNPLLFKDVNIKGHFHRGQTSIIYMNSLTTVATPFWAEGIQR